MLLCDSSTMQEHKSFLIRDLLGDVLSDRVQGGFFDFDVFDDSLIVRETMNGRVAGMRFSLRSRSDFLLFPSEMRVPSGAPPRGRWSH